MKKITYLIYQSVRCGLYLKGRMVLYILCFYITLILPVFCIANYNYIHDMRAEYLYEGLDKTVQIDWMSTSFDTADFNMEEKSSLKIRAQEMILDWDSRPVTVEGRDQQSFDNRDQVKGRIFTDREMKEGALVCLLDRECFQEYGCNLGDTVRVRDQELELIGVISDPKIRNSILVPLHTIKKLYPSQDVKMQYSATFIPEAEEDKDQFISDITARVEEKDESAELLFAVKGEDLQQEYTSSIAKWETVRAAITFGIFLLFLINVLLIIIGKMKEKKKTIAIKMALGLSVYEIGFNYLIEVIMVMVIADVLVFLTIEPLAEFFSLNLIILFDHFVVAAALISSIVIGIIIASAVVYNLRKYSVGDLLKAEDI